MKNLGFYIFVGLIILMFLGIVLNIGVFSYKAIQKISND